MSENKIGSRMERLHSKNHESGEKKRGFFKKAVAFVAVATSMFAANFANQAKADTVNEPVKTEMINNGANASAAGSQGDLKTAAADAGGSVDTSKVDPNNDNPANVNQSPVIGDYSSGDLDPEAAKTIADETTDTNDNATQGKSDLGAAASQSGNHGSGTTGSLAPTGSDTLSDSSSESDSQSETGSNATDNSSDSSYNSDSSSDTSKSDSSTDSDYDNGSDAGDLFDKDGEVKPVHNDTGDESGALTHDQDAPNKIGDDGPDYSVGGENDFSQTGDQKGVNNNNDTHGLYTNNGKDVNGDNKITEDQLNHNGDAIIDEMNKVTWPKSKDEEPLKPVVPLTPITPTTPNTDINTNIVTNNNINQISQVNFSPAHKEEAKKSVNSATYNKNFLPKTGDGGNALELLGLGMVGVGMFGPGALALMKKFSKDRKNKQARA